MVESRLGECVGREAFVGWCIDREALLSGVLVDWVESLELVEEQASFEKVPTADPSSAAR